MVSPYMGASRAQGRGSLSNSEANAANVLRFLHVPWARDQNSYVLQKSDFST